MSSRIGYRPRRAGLLLVVALAVGSLGALALRQSWVRAARAARDSPARRADATKSVDHSAVLGRVVQDGIKIECRVAPLEPSKSGPVREGQDLRIEFSVVDTAGGTPVGKVYPAAWFVSHPEGAPPTTSKEVSRIAAAQLRGSMFNPPEIDLNVFHVVTLNHNATLTVVDPRFGFGGSKLLALVPLASRGDDWALGPGGRRIFVAMPDSNQVAAVDTQTWTVAASYPGGIRPHRLGLQPDGRYLWVAGGADGQGDSGVTVLDPVDGRVAARIRTGPGRHDLAFSDDSRFAFVTNADNGSVSVLDAATLREAATIRTGRRPRSVAYSTRARLAYVSDPEDGTVVAIDPVLQQIAARISVQPGVGSIRFTPDGRAGFVVNPEKNTVSVIDPTANRVVQSAKVEDGPDQVTFTEGFAYIRHRRSVSVVMIALNTAGREGSPLSVNPFPAGERPPGAMDDPTPADSIVPAPGASAVLVANPGDRSVYYYKEGLSAPMGTFSNYKRAPRAALVIDRTLRERNHPGVYETTVRVDRPGKFDVVFYLDQPRIVHAFPIEVRVDPERELARNRGKVDIRPLVLVTRAEVGQTFHPHFQLTDRSAGTLKAGLPDVELLMYRVSGEWKDRRVAREVAPGLYAADFRPDLPGVYHVLVACGSIGLAVNRQEPLIVRFDDPDENRPPPGLQTRAADPNRPRSLP